MRLASLFRSQWSTMLLSPARLTSAVGATIAVAKWEATARKRIWRTKLRLISEQGWNGVYNIRIRACGNTKTEETVDFQAAHARVLTRPSFRKVMLELVNTFSMKSPIKIVKEQIQVSQSPNFSIRFSTPRLVALFFAATLLIAARPAQAANLLVNPGFESNSGHVIPVG